VSWFEGDGPAVAGAERAAKKAKDERKTYKDVIREQIEAADTAKDVVESSSSSEGEDDGDDGAAGLKRRRLGYDAEQKQLRQVFLDMTADGEEEGEEGEDGGLLQVRKKRESLPGSKTKAIEAELERMVKLREARRGEERHDGEEEEEAKESEADRFLRDFVLNKRWVDPDLEEVGATAWVCRSRCL
jgi:hypothetical protein